MMHAIMPNRRIALLAIGASAALGFTSNAHAQLADDITIGDDNAPLHLIEYASLTCPHCAEFHALNWDTLLRRYIDTSRVRFTLREMATSPAPVAVGMFQVARCQTPPASEYFRRVKILFERQREILATGTMAGVRDALLAAGAEWSLSPQEVMQCLNDPQGADRIRRIADGAATLGIDHTPSFVFNGVPDHDHTFLTADGMIRILDARLADL